MLGASEQVCYGGVRLIDRPCPINVRRLDRGALPMVEEFHRRGVLLDTKCLDDLASLLRYEEESINAKIRQSIGREINWNSPQQVGQLLYRELGLKSPVQMRKGQSGAESTDEEMLSSIKDQHEVVGFILEGRGCTKLRTTYAEKLPLMINRETGRLHTVFKYTRAETGRLTSEDPNLQNIPTRTEYGNQIRMAFVPGRDPIGRECDLLSSDLSQIEMVLSGYLSRDPVMCQAFIDGVDIHTLTALRAFGLPQEAAEAPNFKREYRLPAKTIGFGILYGQTAQGAQANILANGGPFWTVAQCDDMITRWFGVYRGIANWMDDQYARARRYGAVWDMWGRLRRIPEARSRISRVARGGLRKAGNMPIQSSAQGVLKLAMAELMPHVKYYQSYKDIRCWPLLQIHDELIFELSPNISEEFADLTKEVMTNVVKLTVPIRASSVVARRWGDLKD